MLQDMIPIVIDLPAQDARIKLLGDLHVGSKEFSQKRFDKWKDSVGDKYIIILGDCIDNGTKTAPGAAMYEQTMSVAAQKEFLYEELKDFAENGQILVGTSGNHEARNMRDCGNDVLYDVFCRWKIEDRYRSGMAFCFFRLNHTGENNKTSGKYRPTYNVLVSHGSGGGALIGSGLNKVERFANTVENLDLIITGHTHRGSSHLGGKLVMDPHNKKVLQREYRSVVCHSFLNYGGYPANKMLSPTGRGDQMITLSSYKKAVYYEESSGEEMIY